MYQSLSAADFTRYDVVLSISKVKSSESNIRLFKV